MILCLPRRWQNEQNRCSNRLFLHKPSDSEFHTYVKYAAGSLPCFMQRYLYYNTCLWVGGYNKPSHPVLLLEHQLYTGKYRAWE